MGKVLMIQGTASNTGKSLLVAGLCRIFVRKGWTVAPFKSQNMALNSGVTANGLEMGRAQILQAQGAQIEPTVDMNPILLKPTSDHRSQVVVRGEVVGTMGASDYFTYRRSLVPIIQESFDLLYTSNDLVIIEGAGSPAEINLKQHDIVNMGMAAMARSPVLLVGDIDCGGVFAALYGTLALLDVAERAMVKGLIINKFRGDLSVLAPGLLQLEELVLKPVTGVVPWMDLDLEDEDSQSDRITRRTGMASIDIAVVRFPRMSNFTDFDPLGRITDASVRYVSSYIDLGRPSLVILPGSKDTMDDLRWMRENGLEHAIKLLAASGVPVLGICGGYQMLGLSLEDPGCVESGGSMDGMGLLPVRTVFSDKKRLTRMRGTVVASEGFWRVFKDVECSGYEIHMGTTNISSGSPFVFLQDLGGVQAQFFDGAVSGAVCGTYLHGLFDEKRVCQALSDALHHAAGMACVPVGANADEHRNEQLEKLADVLEASLDMGAVQQIIEEGL